MQRIVLKLGGSLLHQPDWSQRLWKFIEAIGQHQYYLIVGGGDVVEAMRTLDATHGLNEVKMHWRCVRMLEYTTDVAWEILQLSDRAMPLLRISNPDAFQQSIACNDRRFELNLVDATAFYNEYGKSKSHNIAAPKPGWNTTSDAIAIYCAAIMDADQCVLLKSCDIPGEMTILDAVQGGILDAESGPMYGQYPRVIIRKL
jgi:aspartokinase-like uncharacterized kinase